MTHPLLVWLEERLAETEELARSAGRRNLEWHLRQEDVRWGDQPHAAEVLCGGKPILLDHQDYSSGFAAMHAVRHDPRSVLALIEAHRMILSLHKPDEWGNCSDPCISNWSWAEDVQYEAWPCPTVRALASAYRHAPGWEEAWGPT